MKERENPAASPGTSLSGILLLLLTAMIWGFAFPAQARTVGVIGPLGCTGVRFFIGFLVLLPTIAVRDKLTGSDRRLVSVSNRRMHIGMSRRELIGGGVCGILLFFATSSQQFALELGAGTGETAFITALYMVMIPLIGIFLGRRPALHVWGAVVMAVGGAYLLSVAGTGEGMSGFGLPQLCALLCALLFAVQMTVMEQMARDTDPIRFSAVEFLVVGVLATPLGIFTEGLTASALWECILPMLYLGVLSCGVAYTLQTVAQQRVSALHTSLIFSLESVFAALGSLVLLHESMGLIQIAGCAVILAAVVLSQMSFRKKDTGK